MYFAYVLVPEIKKKFSAEIFSFLSILVSTDKFIPFQAERFVCLGDIAYDYGHQFGGIDDGR